MDGQSDTGQPEAPVNNEDDGAGGAYVQLRVSAFRPPNVAYPHCCATGASDGVGLVP